MHSSCSLNSVLTTSLSTMNCGDRDVSDLGGDVLVTYSVCQICYRIHSTRRGKMCHCCQSRNTWMAIVLKYSVLLNGPFGVNKLETRGKMNFGSPLR